jgi:Cu+-exporting ATPase
MLAGVGRGAQLGILVSGPEVLESASRIDTLLFDKTGTVTTGQLNVVASEGADSLGVGQWRALSALAAASTHPASRAITAHAQAVGPFEQTTLTDIHESAGFGISASADGNTLRLGRPEWSAATVTDARTANDELGDTHTAPDSLSPAVASWRLDGWSVVAFSINGAVRVHFAIADTVRPESADVIAASQQLGMKAFLVTGDHAEVARHVASQVGIPADNVISSAKPEEKVSAVRDLQKQGHRVAMVGDGINDAAALATADIGIAMGAGTGAAIAAGDITVVGSRLELVLPALRLANRTLTTIRSNLAWAFGYNIIMIPLAAAGALNPMIAGFAMASSSVIVVTNSLRLRRFSV